MKTCALIDFFSAHDHVIPSHIQYLNELGYKVTVFSPNPEFREVASLLPTLQFEFLQFDADRYQVRSLAYFQEKFIDKFSSIDLFSEFDLVVLNTFRTELDVMRALSKRCDRIIAFLHTPRGGMVQKRYNDFCAKGHRGIVLGRNMGEEFSLPWVSPLLYAQNELFAAHEYSSKRTFCVPGTVRFSGRNYRALVRAASNLASSGFENFEFKIVGRHDKKDGPAFIKMIEDEGVQRFFTFVQSVSHENFLRTVADVDFVLPLIDRAEEKRSARHYTDMITSSIYLAIGLNKPMVCETDLATRYDIQETSILHSGGRIEEGLEKALKTSQCNYFSFVEQQILLRESLYATSLDNLNTALASL